MPERAIRAERDDDIGPEPVDQRARRGRQLFQRLLGQVTVAEVQADDVIDAQGLSRLLELLHPHRPEHPPGRRCRVPDLARLALRE